MSKKTPSAKRLERVVAKPFVQGARMLEPGDAVRLRQDQIDRLEALGCLEPAGAAGGGKPGASGRDDAANTSTNTKEAQS